MNIIELDKISKTYGQHIIFHDFSLQVEEGEFIAITGKSGSGKSTLLNIMGLIEGFDSGNYTICGIKNPKLGSKESVSIIRHRISYLFQNFALINDRTVSYNLEIAMRFQKKSKAEKSLAISKALAAVGLEDVEYRHVSELSGGEQQRVALSRVILKSSDIILADEPTGSLDHSNKETVLEILSALNKSGKTVVLVTHDNEAVKTAKRVIDLNTYKS